MPSLPVVPKVVRVDYRMSWSSDTDILNRIFVSYTGTLSLADAQTWVNAFATKWGGAGHWQQVVNSGITLTRIELTDLSSATAPQVVATPASPGTGSFAAAPAGVAMVIQFKIARRYRGGHPRIYLVGMDNTGFATPQTWTPSFSANVEGKVVASIVDGIDAQPSAVGLTQQVNVSYYQGFHNVTFPSGRTRPVPTLRGTPLVDVVTGYGVNPNVASQRRRNQQL